VTADSAPRRIDRQRRDRIIQGVLDVIAEHGIEGLTHRRVAAAAAVPLSATTYYFSSLEDMLAAAMIAVVERDLAILRQRFAELPAAGSLAGPLAEIVVEATGPGRRNSVVVVELHTAALRREQLRDIAVGWERSWHELLAPRVGDIAAGAVSAAVAWLVNGALLDGRQVAWSEAEAVLRHVLREPS